MRVPSFLRKTILYLGLGLAALLLAVLITGTLFERQIGQRIVDALNEQLTTSLEVADFNLSFLTHFPNLSASLEDVSLTGNDGYLLAQTDRISFSLSLISFISGHYDLYSVQISDGVLHLRWDTSGLGNYAILREQAPGKIQFEDGESLAFSLRQARLQRIELDLADERSARSAKVRVDEARFSGAFSARQFSLISRAEGQLGYIELDSQRLLVNQPLEYASEMLVDREAERYQFDAFDLRLGSSSMALEGWIEKQADAYQYDLDLQSEQAELADILEWMPLRVREKLLPYGAVGLVTIRGTMRGRASDGKLPPYSMRLELARGRLSGPLFADDLKDLAFSASLQGGGSDPHSLSVERFRGYFGRELLEGRLDLIGGAPASADLLLNGTLPLADIYPMAAAYLDHAGIEQGSGDLELRNLRLQFELDGDSTGLRLARPSASGALVFDDAGLRIRGEDLLLDRGTLSFQGTDLRMDQVKLEGPGTEMVLNGQAENALPHLMAIAEAQPISFEASLTADRIALDRLMALAPLAAEAERNSPRNDSLARARLTLRAELSRRIRGRLEAELENLTYRKVEVESFDGELEIADGEARLEGQVEAMQGYIDLDARIAFQAQPALEATMEGRDIKIDETFRQMENFGQEVVTARNLDGRLHAQTLLTARWDETGNFRYDSLRLLAKVGIERGTLDRLQVLEQFADYVKVEDLRQVRFGDLEHYLEIRNSTVYLPVLFLRSNALNLSLNGLYRFSGRYRFNLKINAGQVLAERFRAHDPDLTLKPARRKGFFNLYYTLQGGPDTFQATTSRQTVREDFERSRTRLRYIQNALAQRFGDTPLIREPEAWQDKGEQFLDFNLNGGRR